MEHISFWSMLTCWQC